ncbi:MAG: MFS transporter [Roseiflexaceae bacterium]|nr:MFS transporter [Roseiflexaceae bacterium]
MEKRQTTWFYGWVVVAITALTLVVSAGVRSAPGVFLLPLRADLGWSRGAISFAVSLGLVLFGLAGPVCGWLMDRFGPRWLMAIGMAIVAASMTASALMTELWQLNLFWGALSGVGTGVASAVLGAAVANRWFVERRGLVVGVFGAATSAGQLIFVPLLLQLVDRYGWRATTFMLAGVAAAIVLPILLLMRNDPADVGQRPLGVSANDTTPARQKAERGVMRRALRSPEFWLLSTTFFVCGATSNGLIGTHLIPYAVDCGIPSRFAAGALALMGLMNFVGTLGSGYLTDRYDPRKLLCMYYGFRGLSLFILPFVQNQTGLTIFAVLFGLDYIATVPPTTMLVANTFGRRNVGTVFGWVFCAHQIGASLAAWLGGLARDSFGSYSLAFIVAGLIALAAGGLALRMGRAAPPLASLAATA